MCRDDYDDIDDEDDCRSAAVFLPPLFLPLTWGPPV
jgi:hypothetical protein